MKPNTYVLMASYSSIRVRQLLPIKPTSENIGEIIWVEKSENFGQKYPENCWNKGIGAPLTSVRPVSSNLEINFFVHFTSTCANDCV